MILDLRRYVVHLGDSFTKLWTRQSNSLLCQSIPVGDGSRKEGEFLVVTLSLYLSESQEMWCTRRSRSRNNVAWKGNSDHIV